jgi:glutamate 5-kinase
MSRTIVAKIGSSTLVGDDGRVRDAVIAARVRDVVEARRGGDRVVLVSSGAIALGLGRLGMPSRPAALPDLQAASAVGQGALFTRYEDAFASHGLVAAQVLLTSSDLERRASYLNSRNTLRRLLELDTVPIVNENDTTATDELTFGDNDVLAAQVAILLRARLLVLLTERPGLYRDGPGGPELIGEVAPGSAPESLGLARMGRSRHGSGGVESKIAAASMAAAAGVRCVVASGVEDGALVAVAAGEPAGTSFLPGGKAESAFKLWLRHAKPASGRIRVDAGAARALRGRGTSLLPVGVVAVEGTFRAGDAVEVACADGAERVGKGIAAMSSEEVRSVAGLRTEEVRGRLPGGADEVVHRDQFVLDPHDVV